MKRIIFRQHALDRMQENNLSEAMVESIIRAPAWAGPDPDRPGIERRFGALPDRPGKWLRVACVEEKDHIRVLSVFPDRNARPPMRPQMTYDPEADAVFVRLSDERPYEGEDVAPGVTLHFTQDGRVVGIEVLPASKTLAPGDWQKAPMPGAAKAHAAE